MLQDTADLLVAYYQLNGATSNGIQDAEREFLIAQGATPAHNQDMWFELLRSLGYTGSIPDMKKDFWCVGGGAVSPIGEAVLFGGESTTFGGEAVTW